MSTKRPKWVDNTTYYHGEPASEPRILGVDLLPSTTKRRGLTVSVHRLNGILDTWFVTVQYRSFVLRNQEELKAKDLEGAKKEALEKATASLKFTIEEFDAAVINLHRVEG